MKEKKRFRNAIHYVPILGVMMFWFGPSFLNSLMVDTPHITHLGFVTIPTVAAALAAWVKVHRMLKEKEKAK